MISALIGLQRSIAMSHYATMGLCNGNPFTKMGAMNYANNATMMKISNAQRDYYQKLLDDNIKRSFSTFA